MLLREFMYVDTEKVRGLLAQLDEGIVESTTGAERRIKSSGGGVKGFAEHTQHWGTEETRQKSLGDLLFPTLVFPTLEHALETNDQIVDLSEQLQSPQFWREDLRAAAPTGSLVRVTGPASLFDARYVAATLAAFAAVGQGLNIVAPSDGPPASPEPQSRPGKNHGRQSAATPELEDMIPDVTLTFGGAEIEGRFLRGIVQVARGIFTPGLHLNMTPTGTPHFALTARLQEGRQFLDGEPDILFARYGTAPQEWTIVGTVGHHGISGEFDAATADFVDKKSGNISRPAFAIFVNEFLTYQATLGFADAPQEPGFSVVCLCG
jgi:hypothetical protein